MERSVTERHELRVLRGLADQEEPQEDEVADPDKGWLGRELGAEDLQPPERRSWQPVDLGPVLDGKWSPPEPTVGRRDDGKGLFYAGKCHTVISETEGGKTWLALSAALDEMHAANHVLFIDFEDDEGTVAGRLLTLGAGRDLIAQQFHYVRPEAGLDSVGGADLRAVAMTYRPTLDVIDGVTEAMSMHGWNMLDNKEAALFGRRLARPLATFGAAVVSLDHVTKDRESRSRYAIGAVHKLNALDGAAYILENRQPFGVGITGRSTIKIAKDRPGQLRCRALPSNGGMHWYGDLVLDSHDQDYTEASVTPPQKRDDNFKPTGLMVKIAEELGKAAQPLPQRELLKLVNGRFETKQGAFARLVAGGYISNKSPHTLIKSYDPEADQ
jgi:AAA domain